MEPETFTLQTSDALNLFARIWHTSQSPKAVVCLIHGHGEHGGRYGHVAGALTQSGFTVFAPDLRGHGRSEGKRGHIPSYAHLMEDVSRLIEEARNRAGQKIFLYGHSMGGNIVLNYPLRIKDHGLSGVIASGPMIRLAFTPPKWKMALARVFNVLIPSITMKSGIDVTAISRDRGVVEAYISDPLVHDRISPRLYLETYNAGLWALNNASNFPVPLLLMHGTADRLTDHRASMEFASRAGSKAKFKPWDGYYHEIHNDIGRADVISYVIKWLDATLAKSKGE